MPRSERRVRVERGLYKAGRTYFACATPPGGRQAVWKTLGEVGLMEARRLRDEFAVEARRAGPPPRSARTTFAEIAGEWLRDQEHRVRVGDLQRRTLEVYELGLRRHALPELGARQVRAITPDDLVAWNRRRQAEGYTPDSIRAWWTPLRLVLAHAVRRGALDTNPADKLMASERPKLGTGRQRFLTRVEMQRLLAETRSPYRLAIAIGLFAGLRVSEALGLVWSDIDSEAEHIRVRFQMGRDGERRRPKTAAASRDVILMPQLAHELGKHRDASPFSADDDLIFASAHGRTIGHRNLTARGLERACSRAALTGVTFHVLRHTFASLLIAQGHDPVFVSRQLGHANPAITLRVYAHLFDAARHGHDARRRLEADYRDLLR
jgi:integrase